MGNGRSRVGEGGGLPQDFGSRSYMIYLLLSYVWFTFAGAGGAVLVRLTQTQATDIMRVYTPSRILRVT